MSTDMTWETVSTSSADTEKIGELVASKLRGGEVIELISDLGGGKTTFVKGVAEGLGFEDSISSPTFTLANTYNIQGNSQGIHLLYHLDFYRISDAGVTALELADYLGDNDAVVIVEWGAAVESVLPDERIKVTIAHDADNEDTRQIRISAPESLRYALSGLSQ